MCNRFNITGTHNDVAEFYDATLRPFEMTHGDIFPGGIAPALLLDEEGKRFIEPMQFGLAKPKSDKPFDRRYPNNNARVEKCDKWPWSDAFKKRRCIVPLPAMHESCWWGNTAGHKVYFRPTESDYLGVASIFYVWKNPANDERLFTMSFLMRPACQYIMDHGHHRQPFFLREDGIDEWMQPGDRSIDASRRILRTYAAEPNLAFEVESELKSFAKNAKAREQKREQKREEQLEAIADSGLPLGI